MVKWLGRCPPQLHTLLSWLHFSVVFPPTLHLSTRISSFSATVQGHLCNVHQTWRFSSGDSPVEKDNLLVIFICCVDFLTWQCRGSCLSSTHLLVTVFALEWLLLLLHLLHIPPLPRAGCPSRTSLLSLTFPPQSIIDNICLLIARTTTQWTLHFTIYSSSSPFWKCFMSPSRLFSVHREYIWTQGPPGKVDLDSHSSSCSSMLDDSSAYEWRNTSCHSHCTENVPSPPPRLPPSPPPHRPPLHSRSPPPWPTPSFPRPTLPLHHHVLLSCSPLHLTLCSVSTVCNLIICSLCIQYHLFKKDKTYPLDPVTQASMISSGAQWSLITWLSIL